MPGNSITNFDGSDAEYLAWLARNPTGFVVNTRRQLDPDYMVLHRANCHSISGYTATSSSGAFTERSYIKICANSVGELRDWVRRNGRSDGSFSTECQLCKPMSSE